MRGNVGPCHWITTPTASYGPARVPTCRTSSAVPFDQALPSSSLAVDLRGPPLGQTDVYHPYLTCSNMPPALPISVYGVVARLNTSPHAARLCHSFLPLPSHHSFSCGLRALFS